MVFRTVLDESTNRLHYLRKQKSYNMEDTMKSNKGVPLIWMFYCSVFLMSAVVMSLLSSFAYADKNYKSVVLVHMNFKNGKWSLGPEGVSILPCKAPSKYIEGAERDPLFRVLGSNGKVVYQRRMRNPRFILVEDPKTEPKLLEQVSFKLRFALKDGMEKFEFWYEPLKQEQPNVSVNLQSAIKKYLEKGGPDQKAPCQEPEYVPNPLKK